MTEAPKQKARDPRNGLRMSATMATIFTLLGHTVFGFEQPSVVSCAGDGHTTALLFEGWMRVQVVTRRATRRTPQGRGLLPRT